jgi:uncharacterized protein DUF4381
LAELPARADPVAGLIDIPLPQEVSLLPQTWASRIAVGLLLVAVIAAVWSILRHLFLNKYRREALAELKGIERAAGDVRPDALAQLTVLVKRTALAAFPREQVASLAGPAWLSFLDRTYGGDEFSHGIGQLLASAPYERTQPSEAQLESLVGLVNRWIRGHHV